MRIKNTAKIGAVAGGGIAALLMSIDALNKDPETVNTLNYLADRARDLTIITALSGVMGALYPALQRGCRRALEKLDDYILREYKG